MQLTDDFASGFAMTIDSFCTAGSVGHNTIPYKDIQRAGLGSDNKSVFFVERKNDNVWIGDYWNYVYNRNACRKLFKKEDYEKVVKFLEVAKNF